ncbi:hypothetical protein D9758_006277 [Tetrapyrgos nigripes]|uniref:Uncharacterized protein n=1 Tax=Tetrapyrgos nigripes TaxID=182062 RepID=A0A8H5D8X7_9AGAR|nr:hypothetical protein D9758_006277 [Tetrapyrgos nigripes]
MRLCLNALRGNDIAFPVKSTAVIVGISTETFTVERSGLAHYGSQYRNLLNMDPERMQKPLLNSLLTVPVKPLSVRYRWGK